MGGARDRRVRITAADLVREAQVGAELGVDERGTIIEHPFARCDRRQGVVGDQNLVRGVLGLGAGRGHHRGHGLALPDRALDRDGVLRR